MFLWRNMANYPIIILVIPAFILVFSDFRGYFEISLFEILSSLYWEFQQTV